MNIPDKVLDGLKSICKEEDIRQLILFGSRAKGTNTERSDVDIAVSFSSERQLSNFREKIDDFNRIHSLLMIDVVNLNSNMISPAVREEIERDGVIIYEKV